CDCRHRQGIGSCSGGNEIDGHLPPENLAEALLDLAVEFARAVGGGEAGSMLHERRRDGGMGSGPVVRCEIHVIGPAESGSWRLWMFASEVTRCSWVRNLISRAVASGTDSCVRISNFFRKRLAVGADFCDSQ